MQYIYIALRHTASKEIVVAQVDSETEEIITAVGNLRPRDVAEALTGNYETDPDLASAIQFDQSSYRPYRPRKR